MNNVFVPHLIKYFETYRADGWNVTIELLPNGSKSFRTNIPLRQPSTYVAEYFNFKRGGIFLDIGAADGVLWSNTNPLEEFLGWSGIAVEPQSDEFEKLSKVRRCICINAAIVDHRNAPDMVFCTSYPAKQISGFVEFFPDAHKLRVFNEASRRSGTIKFAAVACKQISEIVGDCSSIDYMSIDTEGSESMVIESLRQASIRPSLISVEANNYNVAGNTKAELILQGIGYKFDVQVCQDRFYRLCA